MHGSSEVPSTLQLIAMAEASIEQQYNYIDSLYIDAFDQSSINELEIRIGRIEPSAFKKQLEMAIQSRKNQLKSNPFNIDLSKSKN